MEKKTEPKIKKLKLKGPKVKTGIKAGPNRRPFDHIGHFNFKVEIG